MFCYFLLHGKHLRTVFTVSVLLNFGFFLNQFIQPQQYTQLEISLRNRSGPVLEGHPCSTVCAKRWVKLKAVPLACRGKQKWVSNLFLLQISVSQLFKKGSAKFCMKILYFLRSTVSGLDSPSVFTQIAFFGGAGGTKRTFSQCSVEAL